jgi:spermidine synthase
MSAFDPAVPFAAATHARITVPVFAGTMFVSAMLLFSVQPLFAKMVLPLLGGSPSVWSVAMVFFQGMLLAGYGYAHLIVRHLAPRTTVTLHLAVLAIAFAALPVALSANAGRPPETGTELWLVALFFTSVGLPFFAVSATAPLLQAWFARGLHAQAADPYFLYGASNLGSFAALIAYPLVFEPWLTLHGQSAAWSFGFVLLAAMIAVAGALTVMWGNGRAVAAPGAQDSMSVTWKDRFGWIALAFVPSALLIAVTSHISTDVAAAPFLWVIPLALFLATFILTFRAGGERLNAWMPRLQPIVAAALAVGLMRGAREYWSVAILLDLMMLTVSAMVCHRALYARRPQAGHLTSFYLWVSFGGVLGGIASGLLAPRVFPDVWEYPILIVLALIARPDTFTLGPRAWIRGAAPPVAVALAALVAGQVMGLRLPASMETVWNVALILVAALIMLSSANGARMAGFTALLLVASAAIPVGVSHTETARSFFGVHKVVDSEDGRFRQLYHGTTLHGAMRLRNNDGTPVTGRPQPTTYYHQGGAFSDAVAATREARGGHLDHVAIVGLGAGGLACHLRPGEGLTYYEIDPEVVRIAKDPSKFRFLSECAPQAKIAVGDARLTLADETRKFDLLVLDAFSSDVIPVHLLTREAMTMYLDRVKPGGVIALHISNRYLELASVVRDIASSLGLVTYFKRDQLTPADLEKDMHTMALMAAVARSKADLAPLGERNGWTEAPFASTGRAWTDDYSNIPGAIWRVVSGR